MVSPKYKNVLGLKPRDVLTQFERQLYKMQVSDQQKIHYIGWLSEFLFLISNLCSFIQ